MLRCTTRSFRWSIPYSTIGKTGTDLLSSASRLGRNEYKSTLIPLHLYLHHHLIVLLHQIHKSITINSKDPEYYRMHFSTPLALFLGILSSSLAAPAALAVPEAAPGAPNAALSAAVKPTPDAAAWSMTTWSGTSCNSGDVLYWSVPANHKGCTSLGKQGDKLKFKIIC